MLWHGNGIHGLDIALNGPGRWKDLFPNFFRYLSGGGTSRLLFRLGCFASPRKLPFLPFFAGVRCHHTDEWRASQSSRYHSKCHNWTMHTQLRVFSSLEANIVWICWQRSEGRTMLTKQFSLRCDHQILINHIGFVACSLKHRICISPIWRTPITEIFQHSNMTFIGSQQMFLWIHYFWHRRD